MYQSVSGLCSSSLIYLSYIIVLGLHRKILRKAKQIKPQVNRAEAIIKIRVKIDTLEKRKQQKIIQWNQKLVLWEE